MANQGGPKYRIKLNRNPTQKWAQAQPVDYGGDDWGDEDDYIDEYQPGPRVVSQPLSAPGTKQQIWGQEPVASSQRSFTNPVLVPGTGRPSFEHYDDRKQFPTALPGRFEPAPLQTHRPASSQSQQGSGLDHRGHQNQPSLQLDTRSQGNTTQSSKPGFQENQIGSQSGGSVLAHGMRNDEQLQRSHTPNRDEPVMGRSDDIATNSPAYAHPPRKSSLSSQQSPIDARGPNAHTYRSTEEQSPVASKPLTFIRPADIYKRVEEEREKERRSQDSARPSLDVASEGRSDHGDINRGNTLQREDKDLLHQSHQLSAPRTSKLETVTESGVSTQATSPQNHGFGETQDRDLTSTGRQVSSAYGNRQNYDPSTISRQTSSAYSSHGDPISASSPISQDFHLPTLQEMKASSLPPPGPILKSLTADMDKSSNLASTTTSRQFSEDLPQFQRGVAPRAHHTETDLERSQLNTDRNSKPGTERLQHKPSVGYTSVVQKAFDNEDQNSLSTSTTNETLPRSDSVSTSAISPIISNTPGKLPSSSQPVSMHNRDITDDSVLPRGRPESNSTLKARELEVEHAPLGPPPVVPGFRRDSTPPSSGNSPARRPLSQVAPQLPDAGQGLLSTVSPITSPHKFDNNQSNTTTSTTHSQTGKASNRLEDGVVLPPSQPRTASEDWVEWQAQRRSFHAQHNLGSNTDDSPALSSSVSRSESPAKGVVREITGRLESQSGRSTPAIITGQGSSPVVTSRPLPQTRLESFRPSLPGGWESDTTTSTLRNQKDESHKLSRPVVTQATRSSSSESIPTAVAPKTWQPHDTSPIEKAFAAVAAAGTAMAGAFNGPAFTKGHQHASDSDSEDEAYPGSSDRQLDPIVATRDFASEPAAASLRHDPAHKLVAEPSSLPSHAGVSEVVPQDKRAPIDFPAPLRTNKHNESSPVTSRLSIFPPETVSPNEDPDQLQKDIVKSLTPITSKTEEPTSNIISHQANRGLPKSDLGSSLAREDSTASYDDVLPAEYSSYWQEGPSSRDSIPAQVSDRALEPPVQVPAHTAIQPHDSQQTSLQHATPARPSQDTETFTRPLLEQKFSWETTPQDGLTVLSADPTSPNTGTESRHIPRPVSPIQSSIREATGTGLEMPETVEPESPRAASIVRSTTPPKISVPTRASVVHSIPQEKVDFRTILGYNDPYRRIQAFDENKRIYAEPNGTFDDWLSSLNTPDHADAFTNSRRPNIQKVASQSESRNSYRREVATGSGTKQMQEDGKRLLAAAGKYGGKAGVVAKGFFAKGKDRFRSTSASDKGSLTNRRRSTASELSLPVPTRSHQDTSPSTAPQLPPPILKISTGEDSWSLSSTFDRILIDSSNSTTQQDNKRASTGNLLGRQELTRTLDGAGNSVHQDVTLAKPVDTTRSASLPEPILESGLPSQKTHDHLGTPGPTTQDSAVLSMSNSTPRTSRDLLRFSSSKRRRRPSSISDVSEISRSPGPEEPGVAPIRSVSPPRDEVSRSNTRSQEVLVVPSRNVNKEIEARREHENELAASAGHGSLPPYSGPVGGVMNHKIAPGTAIVPVADLKGNQNTDHHGADRPFSFVGTDTFSSVPSYHPGSLPPPLTPVDGAQQQRWSNERATEPDVMNHPAYKDSVGINALMHQNQTQSQSQHHNPFPQQSSQQVHHTVDQSSQYSTQRHDNESTEGTYRIPGPYVQEYRSPKPKPSNERFQGPQARQTNEVGRNSDPVAQPQAHNNTIPTTDNGTRAVTQHTTSGNASINNPHDQFYGGLVQARSRSPVFEDTRDSISPDLVEEKKRQRKVLFRLNSESDDLTPPSEGIAENSKHRTGSINQGLQKRASLTSTPRSKSFGFGSGSQSDGKKKRSSILAGLFSRSGTKDRNRPILYIPDAAETTRPTQEANRYSTQASRVSSEQPRNHYAAHGETSQPMHLPLSNTNSVSQRSAYGETSDFHTPTRTQSGLRSYDNQPGISRVDITNSDQLRGQPTYVSSVTTYTPSATTSYIATATTSHIPSPATSYVLPSTNLSGHASMYPAGFSTSPPVPVTRANRDISYGQDRPYVPSVSPQAHAKPQGNMAQHVKDLHTRSRSPRLGRPLSNENFRGQVNAPPNALHIPDPAKNLGTFSNLKSSPVGAQRTEEDQEKPWTLTLPGVEHEEQERRARERGILPHESDHSTGRHIVIGQGAQANDSLTNHHGQMLTQTQNGTTQPSVGREDSVGPRKSRELKRALLEHTPDATAGANSNDSRPSNPQTVADRIMGPQTAARNTTPSINANIGTSSLLNTTAYEPVPKTVTHGDTVNTNTSVSSSTNGLGNKSSTVVTPAPPENMTNTPLTRALSKVSRADTSTPLSQVRQMQPTPEPQAQPTARWTKAQADKMFAPVELPGSRPDGYESEEEPVMSATAYPGQEWMPVFAGEGRWDD